MREKGAAHACEGVGPGGAARACRSLCSSLRTTESSSLALVASASASASAARSSRSRARDERGEPKPELLPRGLPPPCGGAAIDALGEHAIERQCSSARAQRSPKAWRRAERRAAWARPREASCACISARSSIACRSSCALASATSER